MAVLTDALSGDDRSRCCRDSQVGDETRADPSDAHPSDVVKVVDVGPQIEAAPWLSEEAWTVPAAFVEAVKTHGTLTALVDVPPELNHGSDGQRPQRFTYGELFAEVHAVAVSLSTNAQRAESCGLTSARGSRVERIVGLCVDEGIQLVVAMLAILYAGFAFTPVDLAHWPAERCLHVLSKLNVCLALALERQMTLAERIIDQITPRLGLVSMEELRRLPSVGPHQQDVADGLPQPSPEDLCYVIFTSGSTGLPKGVLCEHGAAISYAIAKAQVEQLTPGDRVLLASHFTFDPAQGDIVGSLSMGATLVAAPRAQVLGDLQGTMHRGQVTHAIMTPTQWALRNPGPLPALRHLSLCGELMSETVVEEWAEVVTLRNMYGVTEATGVQTFHRLSRGDSPRLAGKSFPGYAVGLFVERCEEKAADDSNKCTSELPEGDLVGEVVIGGRGLARGYLEQPAETRRRFRKVPEMSGGAAYFTGDLGRFGAWGLELHGRKDHQVKISGVRVELSEIDSALQASELVTAAVCTVVGGSLHAHVELVDGEEFDWVCQAALEAAAAARLPQQVVPRRFKAHSKLPVASGGKVDRRALEASSDAGPAMEVPFVPLEGPLEEVIANAWSTALNLPVESISAVSNFVWLRGDSWSALRVCRRLQASMKQSDLQAGDAEGDGGEIVLDDDAQSGEAGLLISAEAPAGALCLLAPALGPLAPCELLARPTLREYAQFLTEQGFHLRAQQFDGSVSKAPVADGVAWSGNDSGTRGSTAELALIAAAREGRLLAARVLLGAGVSANGPATGKPPRGFTPLHAAISVGSSASLDVARLLLQSRASARAMTTDARTSPAHIAAAKGDALALELLLEDRSPSGPAAWARDSDGQTVLHLAARAGELAALQHAIVRVRGIRASEGGLEARDRWNRTAFQWAVANGHDAASVALMVAGACTSGVPEAVTLKLKAAAGREKPQVAWRKMAHDEDQITALVHALPEALVANSVQDHQVFAITSLRDLCCGARNNREAAVAVGAVPRLVGLLEFRAGTAIASAAVAVIAAAAQTLRNLGAEKAGAEAVAQAGGIPALAAVVASSGGNVAAWRAASALAQLAVWHEHWEAIRQLGTGGTAPALRALVAQTQRLNVLKKLLGAAECSDLDAES